MASKREQLAGLAEDKRNNEALIHGYIVFQDDFDRRIHRAEVILIQAQADVDDLRTRLTAIPDKIAGCELRLRQIAGDLDKKVRQPRLSKIDKLKAQITKLEQQITNEA